MKLTDICDFQGGSQAPPKEEWSFDKQDGYVRMLQIRDFTQSERVTTNTLRLVTAQRYVKLMMIINCKIWGVNWKDIIQD